MPNLIPDFIPWRVHQFVEATLEDISTGGGFNTNPVVVTDVDDWENSPHKFTLLVEVANSTTENPGAGTDNRTHPVLRFNIYGSARYETENPVRLGMALEQDVRTALHEGKAGFRAAVSRSGSFRFDRCTYDRGYLSPENQVGFVLEVSFKWSQNSGW